MRLRHGAEVGSQAVELAFHFLHRRLRTRQRKPQAVQLRALGGDALLDLQQFLLVGGAFLDHRLHHVALVDGELEDAARVGDAARKLGNFLLFLAELVAQDTGLVALALFVGVEGVLLLQHAVGRALLHFLAELDRVLALGFGLQALGGGKDAEIFLHRRFEIGAGLHVAHAQDNLPALHHVAFLDQKFVYNAAFKVLYRLHFGRGNDLARAARDFVDRGDHRPEKEQAEKYSDGVKQEMVAPGDAVAVGKILVILAGKVELQQVGFAHVQFFGGGLLVGHYCPPAWRNAPS